ncbi:MAG: NAD(+) synthase [Oscillospiraceae bacterium]|nr:NAD(+) synthase [Oscillospiraceae bacterium]
MNDGFLKIAAATPKIHVADPAYNAAQVISMAADAAQRGAKVCVFPELVLTGYTCQDLFGQRTLLQGALDALARVAAETKQLELLVAVGLPFAWNGCLYNVAALVYGGEILGLVPKRNLPNYGEFYEKRHFVSGSGVCSRQVMLFGAPTFFGTDLLFCHSAMPEVKLGVELCEDLWVPNPPSIGLAMAGATIILNLSASDETVTKDEYRRALVCGQSARLVCGYVYCNAGDGESTQDLVYTGHDLICENGSILAQSESTSGLIVSEIDAQRLDHERRKLGTFQNVDAAVTQIYFGGAAEETALTRTVGKTPFVPQDAAQRAKRCEQIFNLQSLGLKKRIEHTCARAVVIGVSGGLDSTLAMLVAARAMDLCGRDRKDILSVTMPCFGTTKRTRSNAEILAERLGATLRVVDITRAVQQHFSDIGHDPAVLDVTFENSQARERTQVIMDLANQAGGFVVGTGDLSELALGWATYNGDHMSMYGVNASIPKTLVRHLVRYMADTCGDDALRACLLDILDTPVSPELLPAKNGEISQKTEDLVGPYALHDFFLYQAIRCGCPPAKVFRLASCAFAGDYDRETILKWLRTFYRRFFTQQFKRSCLPDGPKVGSVTLSPRGDWRMPSDAVSALWLQQAEAL